MSAYAKLPSDPNPESQAPLERAERIAGSIGQGIGAGLRDASRAIGGPRGTEVEELIASTDLPQLDGADVLRDLAARIDREADLWRNLAFRELANSRFTDRMVQIAGSVLGLGTLVLSSLAALGALFGAEAWSRVLLLGAGALLLAIGVAGAVAVASFVRRGQRETVRAALARADLAELRFHRVAIAIAERGAAPDRSAEILARLERDARG